MSKLYKDETFKSPNWEGFEKKSCAGSAKQGFLGQLGYMSPNSKTLRKVHIINETRISDVNNLILLLLHIKH